MHVPRPFAETRVEILHNLIRAHPVATLVTLAANANADANELDANHIPFEIDPDPAPFGTLRGHVARANPLWRDYSRETGALAIFRGPDAYVSPSWYATKQTTGKVVPTWNYAVVHAHGPLRVIEDREWLRALVEKLTNRHEARRAQPWKVTDAPDDFIEEQLDAIIGLEIPVARLVGKYKASQNRPARDRDGVVEGLLEEAREASVEMAGLVRRRDE